MGMAGTNSGFSADGFRAGIRFAMTMGAPPTAADQLTFGWNAAKSTTATRDGEGVPFDPTAAVTATTPTPVKSTCAVEYLDAAGEPTPFGVVIPSKLRITLLDEEYATVGDADFVVMGGDKYLRSHEPPSLGLFDVGVHQIIFMSENEL